MGANLLLGVDVGTYSSKGVLTTPESEVLAIHSVEHDLIIPHPGWAEHDPERTWWGEFVDICRVLLQKARCRGSDVAGVAVSGIGPALLPVDRDGRPLRRAILYGIDTRATREIAELNRRYGSEHMYRVGGSVLTSQAVGPKILWLKVNEPDVYSAARYFHSASDYIVLRLTGHHVMDMYTASLYNPLFDISEGTWTTRFSEDIVSLDRLPKPAWASEIAGEVSHQAARETNLAAGTPVTVGTVDAVAEAVSVGAIHPGDLMCMYGTTTFFILAGDSVVRQPTMWAVCHALPDLYGVAAGMSTTGALTRWFRDNFARDLIGAGGGDQAYSALAEEASQAPAGSLGLVVLPYFSGERTPINDPQARGLICGLTLSHERRHVYRAILEGTAYGIRHNLETMQEAGARPNRILAVGGGAKNQTWLQIISDVTGAAQQIPVQTIGAAYGDAFLAGYASGAIPGLEVLTTQWVEVNRTVEPNPALSETYGQLYGVYRSLYMHSAGDQHALAEIASNADLAYSE